MLQEVIQKISGFFSHIFEKYLTQSLPDEVIVLLKEEPSKILVYSLITIILFVGLYVIAMFNNR